MAISIAKTKKSSATLSESSSFWEPIGKRLVAVLAKKYRLPFTFQSSDIELSTYEALAESKAADGSYLASVFRSDGVRSPIFFTIDGVSGASICNILLGGSVKAQATASEKMDLQVAPITRQLETRFLQVFAGLMKDELAKFGFGNLRYGSSETDLRLFSQIPADTSCVQVRVSFKGGDQVITLAMFLPADAGKRLGLQKQKDADSTSVQTLSYKHLQDLEVDVSVALGTLSMTLKELVALIPGEILSLDQLGGEDAQLRIEGKYFKSGQLENGDDSKWIFVVAESN